MSPARPLRPGVYAPTMTFFQPDESLDLPTISRHSVRLAQAGLAGLVTMGSNGEAVHLSAAEKSQVTQTTRRALDEAGYAHIPVIAGTSEQSVVLAVQSCRAAKEAGADYCLMLPPSYYRAQSSEAMIEEFFVAVAKDSPIPIILYNYPGAVSGVDLDSDLMIRLARKTGGKVCGAKFTDANTGKLTRVAAATGAVGVMDESREGWMAFGGIADFTVQTAASGGSGIIAGGANVMPKLCVEVWKLWKEGKYAEAMELQKVLSKGDWVLTKSAIAGTKAALDMEFGYGGFPRRPLQRLSEAQRVEIKEGIAEAMKVEGSL